MPQVKRRRKDSQLNEWSADGTDAGTKGCRKGQEVPEQVPDRTTGIKTGMVTRRSRIRQAIDPWMPVQLMTGARNGFLRCSSGNNNEWSDRSGKFSLRSEAFFAFYCLVRLRWRRRPVDVHLYNGPEGLRRKTMEKSRDG